MSAGWSGYSSGGMKKFWRVIFPLLLLLGLMVLPASAVQCDGDECPMPDGPSVITSSTRSTRGGDERETDLQSLKPIYSLVPSECPTTFEIQAILLINAERAQVGLGPLQLDTRLQAAARWFANDVAVNGLQDPPHEGSDGSIPQERIEAQGYNWTAYGETLGVGLGEGLDSPEKAVEGWMNSMDHMEILLGDYEHVGLGHSFMPAGAWHNVWVADFGNTAGARFAPPAECDPEFHETFFPIVGK